MSAQQVDLIEKACTKCGEVKPLTGFYRNARMKDGHYTQCVSCRRASSAASKERRRAEDPEGFLVRQLQSVNRHRRRTGNARGKAVDAARREATRRLVVAHQRQFDTLYRLVKAERGLLSDRDYRDVG